MHHIFYHANCADGFSAATLVRRALLSQGVHPDNLDCTAVNYGDTNQLPCGDNHLQPFDEIIYVDYTPPQHVLDTLVKILDGTLKLTILDHHEKAAPLHGYSFNDSTQLWEHLTPPPFNSVFNLAQSGAALAWNYFWKRDATDWDGQPAQMPYAVQVIQHRDLGFAFQQPLHPLTQDSLNLHAYLFRCLPRTFDAWEHVINSNQGSLQNYECAIGARIRVADSAIIDAAVDRCHWLYFSHFLHDSQTPSLLVSPSALSRIPAVNGLDAGMISDACQALLRAHPSAPFSASWFVNHRTGQIVYSLRSREPGHPDGHVNVSKIAAACSPGGGGHPCAAGFQTLLPIPFAS